jgi:CTP:phosphocholine cytidylyltransferase-like protein/thiamine kinase-like enzyme
MNKFEKIILLCLAETEQKITQRDLVLQTGFSLGSVNKALNVLRSKEYIDDSYQLTRQAWAILDKRKPKRAIILAAGFGLRMIPINTEVPKGLLEVRGERLIERIIRQLHKVGITEIHVVVGFLKEQYEYLIDAWGVHLIVNMSYASKNNLHSLNYAQRYLDDAYIIPCDIWAEKNPFRTYELSSWYMITEAKHRMSTVTVNRQKTLFPVPVYGNYMVGIAYITQSDAVVLRKRLDLLANDASYDNSFWEQALFLDTSLKIQAKVVSESKVLEINTYEQLRSIDSHSDSLSTGAMQTIEQVFDVQIDEIVNVELMKKGMTNRSFIFSIKDQRYIMRIPGEGTDQLINRKQEYAVYQSIKDLGFTDQTIYFNPDNGYKITEFLENIRVCDPANEQDVKRCMVRLKEFHSLYLVVPHEFNVVQQIEFYESLWEGKSSVFADYETTKKQVLALQAFIDTLPKEWVLCHIDAVPDNFLLSSESEAPVIIDWEYAAMQDPHIDIAMFAIYSFYTKDQIDWLIDLYFDSEASHLTRLKIYAYVAMSGLLWSNWSEYKRNLGVEFGEYIVRQYRYAKEFSRIVHKELKRGE